MVDISQEEYKALLKDKERLDWIENQSNGDDWIARDSTTGRGFRLHNTTGNVEKTAREAIDVAMNGQKYRIDYMYDQGWVKIK